ncbi:phage portal protein [Oenococcus oeni]|uniref:phage portal protein n=6 Tax=Oenococcus oeni TaxID=1247 RepID=UPI00027777E1|nr:phage portal protein [Oenococcus oeni]EJN91642.1 phage head-tail joining protein [Oenococcus oeni AWRIB304]KER91134.1 portal protein [Oenococcus oeni]KER91748.1 portal protein [Oenococcus oeni]KGH59329.1 portal protein [Oenococcus oeni S28]KGI06694.1 portal protein [Oenococcus oeni S19]
MPLFHSNFHIRDSTTGEISGTPIDDWTSIINFLNPKNDHYISAFRALKNPDIHSTVMQLSGDLATATLTANGPRAQGILDNPSATANARTFWVTMFAQMILGGESFAYRWRNANGIDARWEYLRPSQVQVYELSDGSGLTYNLSFDEPDIGMMENVPQSDMIHLRYFSMNAMTGFSPLYSLVKTLDIKKQSDVLTLKALAQSVTANSVLQEPANVDDNYAMARSKTLMKQLQTSGGIPVVLAPGETFTPLEIKSNISSLLSQVDWTSTQIAKAFQIPDSYLNGQGDQQSSLDQIEGLYANTLNRDMNMVLSELNNKLNANITADIRKAIDPLGNDYATSLLGSKNLTAAQVFIALKESGYLSQNVPNGVAADPPQEGENVDSTN